MKAPRTPPATPAMLRGRGTRRSRGREGALPPRFPDRLELPRGPRRRWLRPAVTWVPLVCVAAAACAEPIDPGMSLFDGTSKIDAGFELSFGGFGAAKDGVAAPADASPLADVATPATPATVACEFAAKPGAGAPGAPCNGPGECDSAVCIDSPLGKVCTKTCLDCCPTNWRCVDVGAKDPVFACVPRYVNLCRPCLADADCAEKGDAPLCVSYGAAGRFCGGGCTVDADCPADHACVKSAGTGGSDALQCVRKVGACTCSPAAVATGAKTTCQVSNGVGSCPGTRACGAGGLSACDAATAATETCNGQDEDCDGLTDEVGAAGCANYWPDGDGDGFGLAESKGGKPQCLCAPTSLYTAATALDCDDKDKSVKPSAIEACDDDDDDCDGTIDDGCDDDKDGWCDVAMAVPSKPLVCPEGPGDCDDALSTAYPGGKELCANGKDDNCNGATDEAAGIGCVSFWQDADGDGAGTDQPKCLCSAAGGYTATQAGDCNDDDAKVGPKAKEQCGNAKDDDCNGKQDEAGSQGCIEFWKDIDSDGWGFGDSVCLCAPSAQYTVKKGGDCDDTSPKLNPAMIEVCNGQDDDCDGTTDEVDAINCTKFFADADKDGFGDSKAPKCLCKPEGVWTVTQGGDCDDQQGKVFPQAKEACNGADDDCDGQTDETGAAGCQVWFADEDDDTWGDDAKKACLCAVAPPYKVQKGGDCNDKSSKVSPAAKELCNGLDDDCNGTKDDENAQGCTIWLFDDDGDGWGLLAKAKCLCGASKPWSAQKGDDCDDEDPAVKPKAAELCNGKDDDCDGDIDEAGAQGCLQFFADGDGDGYGSTLVPPQCLCKPVGTLKALQGGDCNDGDKLVFPKATEACNGKDDDCDGAVDPVGAQGCKTFFADTDNDGFGSNASQCACAAAGIFTASQAGDCNDQNPAQKPGLAETCNGQDDNCNGVTDNDAADAVPYYQDGDGDGYGTGAAQKQCGPGAVYKALQSGDCNDGDGKVNPGMAETCNGKNDNCKDGTDEGQGAQLCPGAQNATPVCQAGQCKLQCAAKLFDVDGQYGNGCECAADVYFGVTGGSCGGAQDLGPLPDSGAVAQVSGNVMPGEPGDWFRFKATDLADTVAGACDKFHVKVKVVGNPGGAFVVDLYRGGCAGVQQLCAGQTDTGWTVNFYGGAPSGPAAGSGVVAGNVVKSPQPEAAGECKCATGTGLPGMNVCTDNSADFFVRVYRASGTAASCQAYTVQVSNGL
ncbi:MAG: hypothetical protein EXR79_15260 [Myxococcales bacterium]|nr:hypothetical protein [Myxococcales bacterium]